MGAHSIIAQVAFAAFSNVATGSVAPMSAAVVADAETFAVARDGVASRLDAVIDDTGSSSATCSSSRIQSFARSMMLSMHDVGFITEDSVWATNP